MKKFLLGIGIILLAVVIFVLGLWSSNTINPWFDKTFVSKDSKIVGEWSVEKIKLTDGEDSFEITAEEYEKFVEEYNAETATELEKKMYNSADFLFAQKYSFTNEDDERILEVYTINEDGEKEIENTFTWTFEKGIVTVENEEDSFSCEYTKDGCTADDIWGDGIILSQTLVKNK